MRTLLSALLSILALLAVAQAPPALAEEHGHVWGAPECEAPSCVGRCCTKKCIKFCVICAKPVAWSETTCSGAGATGQYSTDPLMSTEPAPAGGFGGGGASGTIRPSGGCRDGLDHDWGEWRYGEWSSPFPSKPDCEVRTKSRTCSRCGTDNTQMERRGQCRAPGHTDHDHDVALVSTPWGPRPGSTGNDSCPPHDWAGPNCSGWSRVSDKCRVKHCTYQCRKCQTNGRDYMEQDPPGCFD